MRSRKETELIKRVGWLSFRVPFPHWHNGEIIIHWTASRVTVTQGSLWLRAQTLDSDVQNLNQSS